ncbi:MAG: FKBP-type peptidyl-prolyl cis-trans isomerase [Pseudomonadota bacterium]
MNKGNIISGLVVILAFISSSVRAEETAGDLEKDMGYFFGYSFGNMLKDGGNEEVDIESLISGMRDSLANQAPNLDQAQQQAVIAEIQANQQRRQEAAELAQNQAAETNLAAAQAFLAENAKKAGVKVTSSGLQYEIIEAGIGETPTAASRVRVHYDGRLVDGSTFDSSRQRGQPAEFGLNQVIAGWTEGLQLVSKGGRIRLFIPPELGYGPGGTGGIPPNAVLIFDVELLDIL